jgi:hypothetical protein
MVEISVKNHPSSSRFFLDLRDRLQLPFLA